MIVYGAHLAEWARQRIPHVNSWGACQAIGHERRGKLIAVCVFNHYSPCDIAMHIATDGRHWCTREFMRACFGYAFNQCGVNRVTGYVPRGNARALRLNAHIGFVREGVMREALPDDDVVVMGMLRSECRWLA